MFTPVDYNFTPGKRLMDYGMEESQSFPFRSVRFEENVLKLVARDEFAGEIIFKTESKNSGLRVRIKLKNSKGNAITSEGKPVFSNQYVDTVTTGSGVVILMVRNGGSLEFTGYSLE
jgi:hypothetical protein